MLFTDDHIQIAGLKDIEALIKLLNNAYRGEGSKKGWTTEADLIAGEIRTNEIMLHDVIQKQGSVILKYLKGYGDIVACVNLQKHGSRLYLGMFSVSPELQGAGIGKKILLASEEYAKHTGCASIYMSVISVRDELINWYKRHGYIDTGEKKPFHEDEITGKHLQPLEFMIMEKWI